MTFNFDGMTAQMEPAITKWGYKDLEDDPASHRWRAHWVTESLREGLTVTGIMLEAYPVIKTNRSSVWINEDAQRCGGSWEVFDPTWMKKRLLHNGSGSAWAKPTQEEALFSLAVRLTRWANHLARDVQKAKSAADVLEKLRPGLSTFAQDAKERLEGKEWAL